MYNQRFCFFVFLHASKFVCVFQGNKRLFKIYVRPEGGYPKKRTKANKGEGVPQRTYVRPSTSRI